MMHTSYPYGSLELHKDKGQRALRCFFATAGISPANFGQLYGGVERQVRSNLWQMFREHGPRFGLDFEKISLDQFVRNFGNWEEDSLLKLHELSASDASHILTAL